jgi:hypothetical protein
MACLRGGQSNQARSARQLIADTSRRGIWTAFAAPSFGMAQFVALSAHEHLIQSRRPASPWGRAFGAVAGNPPLIHYRPEPRSAAADNNTRQKGSLE